MPVGATIGAAAITTGGAILGGQAQKKAAKSAAASQDAATQAQLQAERESQQLYRDTYNSNLNVLSPYNQLGYSAASARNALLGLGAGPAYSAPTPLGAGPTGGTTGAPGVQSVPVPGAKEAAFSYLMSQIGPKRTAQINALGGDTDAKLNYALSVAHDGERAAYQNYLGQHPMMTTQAAPAAPSAPATPATTPQQDYGAAFNNYLDSTGYKFQLGQGLEGLAFAKRLTGLDSGDMVKSAIDYNRDMGQQYFGNYMGLLGQQQGLGIGAASAIAGQGSQYAANMAGSNSSIGNALANGAISNGNLALAMGGNQANMYGQIAGGIGNAVGQIWKPSSYTPPADTSQFGYPDWAWQ